jgi:hypothetical protein
VINRLRAYSESFMDDGKLLLIALQVLGGGFCTLIWFNFREVKQNLKAVTEDLALYKLHIAENYVTQNELTKAIDGLSKAIDGLSSKLDRIDYKLDTKQDKS